MIRSSKLVGLVLLSSTAFLTGCGHRGNQQDAQGMYTDSNGNRHYGGYYGGHSYGYYGHSYGTGGSGGSSSSSEHGGFGSHGSGGSGGGGE